MKIIASFALSLLFALQAGAVPSQSTHRPVPVPLRGLTLDDVDNLPAIVKSLSSLQKMPTARIVFDEGVDPSYYRRPLLAIHDVSYTMGEILDSYYVNTLTPAQYIERTRNYLAALSDVVDIWEIGNEVNGEWLGPATAVTQKVVGAYDLVKSQGKTTALTLYYNQGCWENKENEMFAWSEAHIPHYMKTGLDYVFISYYEDDCEGLKPDWQAVFNKLGVMFPNSKIGFGEVGTARKAKKSDYLSRYYTMKINTPKYVGGHFWWYYKQDMVPYTKGLWKIFNKVTATP